MRSLKRVLMSTVFLIGTAVSLQAQRPDSILYKEVDSVSLYLHIDFPLGYNPSLELSCHGIFLWRRMERWQHRAI
jgi:hypothetical protein